MKLCKVIIPQEILEEIVEKYGVDNVSLYWSGTKKDLQAIERLYKDRAFLREDIKTIEKAIKEIEKK